MKYIEDVRSRKRKREKNKTESERDFERVNRSKVSDLVFITSGRKMMKN